jgi:hypothetical protein
MTLWVCKNVITVLGTDPYLNVDGTTRAKCFLKQKSKMLLSIL